MTEEEKKALEEQQAAEAAAAAQAAAGEAEGAAADAEGAAAVAEGAAGNGGGQQPNTAAGEAGGEGGSEGGGNEVSARDRFRQEYSGRYTDVDLSDDEAYVAHLNERLRERDGYEQAFNNMSDALGRSSMFNDMLEAAKENPDFDPVVWAVETGQLDMEAMQSDPEYAEKLADAQSKAMKRKVRQKELEDEQAKNVQPSIEMVNRVSEELGLSEEEKKDAFANMYRIMNDLIVNKVDEDLFRMVVAGMHSDQDREQAREEGYAEGVAKKVDEKLRSMPKQAERNGGRQTPRGEQQETPKRRESNMFGI